MRSRLALPTLATLLLAGATSALAQASSSSSRTASAPASSSSSSTSSAPAPSSADAKTTISLPPLYECEFATWTYTAPVGPKYLGIYVTGSQNFLETYSLPSVYDERTNGTFSWKCDLPAGLSVAAMFYVVADGASGTNGAQASTPDAIINAGSSGSDCLGTNDPASQAQIYSLASSLDPSFSATKSNASPTSAASSGSGGGTNVGAIVGGVVGGVVGIALIALLLVYLKRKHDAQANDAYSLYSGRSEKRGSFHQPRYGEGPASTGGLTAPPPGTYYATDDQGNLHLVMGYPPTEGEPAFVPPPPEPAMSEAPLSPAPLRTAPAGTLPEPMDESTPPKATSSVGATPASPLRGTTPPASPALTSHPFTPVTERNGFLAHQGLDDPSTFSPARSQR